MVFWDSLQHGLLRDDDVLTNFMTDVFEDSINGLRFSVLDACEQIVPCQCSSLCFAPETGQSPAFETCFRRTDWRLGCLNGAIGRAWILNSITIEAA